MAASQEEIGEHDLKIRFLKPDGEELVKPIETKVNVQINEVAIPFITKNLILPLNGLEIPTSGLYSVEITADEDEPVVLQFAVVKVEADEEEADD